MDTTSSLFGVVSEELAHLRSQNEQLWKIIEKQRIMIQNLQKDNARLATERDGIAEKLHALQREMGRNAVQRAASIIVSPDALAEMAETDGPTSPSLDIVHSPVDSVASSASPVPPPRSPYRAVRDANASSASLGQETHANNSTQTLVSTDATPVVTREHHQRAKPQAPALDDISPSASESHGPLPTALHMRKEPVSPVKRGPSLSFASPIVSRSPDGRRTDTRPLRDVVSASPPGHDQPPYRNKGNGILQNSQFAHDNAATTQVAAPPKPPSHTTSMPASHTAQKSELLGDLANVVVKVTGSSIKLNDKGKEVVSFTISVGRRRTTDDHVDELWRIEKLYSDFLGLDTKLKSQPHQDTDTRASRLPDKALFTTHAPSKVDLRKAALEQYLQHMMSLPWQDATDLYEFLSSNVLRDNAFTATGHKEGYLTKRGKNFGGWKTRYFVLNGSTLEYFESNEGNQLGSIRLTNAQIGRQAPNPNPAADGDNAYRHAFLILEQRKPGSSHVVRHILCADSDEERDAWVEAIFQNIDFDDDPPPDLKKDKPKTRKILGKDRVSILPKPDHIAPLLTAGSKPPPSDSTDSADSSLHSNAPQSRASVDHLPLGHNPQTPPNNTMTRRSSMSNLAHSTDEPPLQPTRTISTASLQSGDEPPDALDSSAMTASASEQRKAKNKANRMTFWGKRVLFSSSPDLSSSISSSSGNLAVSPKPSTSASATTDYRASIVPTPSFRNFLSRTSSESTERSASIRKQSEDSSVLAPSRPVVFGVPLEEAVRISRIQEDYHLPAIVYRCIEYLDAKNAVMEEGLYRLSGSNTVIKNLRDSFNQEYDVNLLASKEEYDVHAVAGLLKMWLRELPTSVLTRERRMDFLHVIDLLDRKDRVNELGRLVSQLPLANYTLLRALTAHLIRVVQHAEVNKMTMRNVSIVFSPTLGIPAMVFNLFLSEFEYIFWTTKDGDAAPRMIEEPTISVTEPSEATLEEPASIADALPEQNKTDAPDAVPQIGRKPTLKLKEEFGRSNRNSVSYIDGAPNAIVDLEKQIDGAAAVMDEDDDEEELNKLQQTTTHDEA